eukprot:9329377-Karenia_brevis.AAC.1
MRLINGGIEEKLWPTQFGFRRERGTQDAIFIVRRLIERSFNFRHSHTSFLALDWARAFDSIDPACLTEALRRFGLPDKLLHGCPLSPYLFIMVMTILLHDSRGMLEKDY